MGGFGRTRADESHPRPPSQRGARNAQRSAIWLNGAAQESNLPSRGLHDLTGFEDRLGHRARAAPRLSVSAAPTLGSVEAPADQPLRRDVRLLGDLLGRVLVEQEDETLLADVERVRALARDARAGAPRDELRAAFEELPLERQASVLRAFGLYFQLANVAEQHHRLRRRREYAREQRVPRESLAAACAQLGDRPRT